jgi:hypothetical protein
MMLVANSASALLFGALAEAMGGKHGKNTDSSSSSSGGGNTTTVVNGTTVAGGTRDVSSEGQDIAAGAMGGLAAMFLLLALACFLVPSPPTMGKRKTPKAATALDQ